jgi:hypothetical protein
VCSTPQAPRSNTNSRVTPHIFTFKKNHSDGSIICQMPRKVFSWQSHEAKHTYDVERQAGSSTSWHYTNGRRIHAVLQLFQLSGPHDAWRSILKWKSHRRTCASTSGTGRHFRPIVRRQPLPASRGQSGRRFPARAKIGLPPFRSTQ